MLEKAPCDVVVFRNLKKQKYNRALVPVSGGQNTALAASVAASIMNERAGHIECVHIQKPRSIQFRMNDCLNLIGAQPYIEKKIIESLNPVRAILKETLKSDLVVIGASGTPSRNGGIGCITSTCRLQRQVISDNA